MTETCTKLFKVHTRSPGACSEDCEVLCTLSWRSDPQLDYTSCLTHTAVTCPRLGQTPDRHSLSDYMLSDWVNKKLNVQNHIDRAGYFCFAFEKWYINKLTLNGAVCSLWFQCRESLTFHLQDKYERDPAPLWFLCLEMTPDEGWPQHLRSSLANWWAQKNVRISDDILKWCPDFFFNITYFILCDKLIAGARTSAFSSVKVPELYRFSCFSSPWHVMT